MKRDINLVKIINKITEGVRRWGIWIVLFHRRVGCVAVHAAVGGDLHE